MVEFDLTDLTIIDLDFDYQSLVRSFVYQIGGGLFEVEVQSISVVSDKRAVRRALKRNGALFSCW